MLVLKECKTAYNVSISMPTGTGAKLMYDRTTAPGCGSRTTATCSKGNKNNFAVGSYTERGGFPNVPARWLSLRGSEKSLAKG